MLGVEFIRSNPDEVRQALSFRGASESVNLVDEVLEQDRILREALTLQQAKQQEINSASRTVGNLMREGNKEAATDLIQRQKNLKAEVKELGPNRYRFGRATLKATACNSQYSP